ncbi:cytochrome P450 [Mycolicibacterium flavescens]|uniref:cytochrome P450 n=1 Tax=Mycolicibacterium flavescens TaxID=1776 RepID=UPI000A002F99|nr:cytochrome P450 [Mycolicibacterium flavescens]MCV7280258.1 cytochrome P450 [Mycolicibacterium flavescens]
MTTIERAEAYDTDLDQHSAEFMQDPYGALAQLRDRCPVAKSSSYGGFWVITGYDEIFEALHDTEVFSSTPDENGKGVPPAPGSPQLAPIDFDPPDVGFYRSFLFKHMSPGAAKKMQPTIAEMTGDFIDAFIEKGHADLSQELFTALPAQLILRVLGFDDTRWREWMGWVHGFVHERVADPEGSMNKILAMAAQIVTEINESRESQRPGLMTLLINDEQDGRKLTDADLVNMVFLLILGGMDTTAGLTGNALLRIASDDKLRQRIIDDPQVLDRGTEEFLRHDTPTIGLSRRVAKDAVFHGRKLKKGDRVLLMYAAGNRDPRVFDDPDVLDLDRPNTKHMAFALGVHRCLGSNLARVMFKTMITEVLSRMPDFQVVTDRVERYPDAGDVYAVKHLPVTFTPGTRRKA